MPSNQSADTTQPIYTTLINCTPVTVDRDDTFHHWGSPVIKDRMIDETGSHDEIIPKGYMVDMGGKIALPGLINTHTHGPATLLHGAGDDLLLNEWLTKIM